MAERGNCGGPVIDHRGAAWTGPPLPHLGREFDAVRGQPYIRDSDVVRVLCADDASEAGRWFVCPVSETRAAHEIIGIYRRWREGLPLGVGAPSASLTEALLTLRDAEAETEAARFEEG